MPRGLHAGLCHAFLVKFTINDTLNAFAKDYQYYSFARSFVRLFVYLLFIYLFIYSVADRKSMTIT